MALPTTDLSMSAIQTEFGGSNPISLSEYYKGGLYVSAGATDPNTIPTSGVITIGDFRGAAASGGASPTYSATPAASSVDEGSSLTINVATTNVSDGTTLYWTILNGTSSNADFSSTSGSFTITTNAGSFSVSPVADSTTEGAETFQVEIRTGSTSGTVVDTTTSITINDTSTATGINAQPTTSSFTNTGSSSGTVSITFEVQNAGTFYAESGGTAAGTADFSNGTKGTWLSSGTASDYEVQIVWSGDTSIISGPTGFNALSSTQSWDAVETYPSGNYTVTGAITIRDIATSGATELDTGSITININAS